MASQPEAGAELTDICVEVATPNAGCAQCHWASERAVTGDRRVSDGIPLSPTPTAAAAYLLGKVAKGLQVIGHFLVPLFIGVKLGSLTLGIQEE